MAENKIQETVEIVVGEEHNEPVTTAQPAQNIVLDASTPSVRSILRVVLVTLVILSVADFFKSIITSLTHLFFLIVLSIFFAYLIEPLVQMIRRPFEVANRDNYMPRPLAIAAAYLIVFSTLGIAVAVLTPLVNAQIRQLTTNLPTYSSAIQRQFRDLSNRYERYRFPKPSKSKSTRKPPT
jgi:predicted PurR-regulated permease PerM